MGNKRRFMMQRVKRILFIGTYLITIKISKKDTANGTIHHITHKAHTHTHTSQKKSLSFKNSSLAAPQNNNCVYTPVGVLPITPSFPPKILCPILSKFQVKKQKQAKRFLYMPVLLCCAPQM